MSPVPQCLRKRVLVGTEFVLVSSGNRLARNSDEVIDVRTGKRAFFVS
jgi:hypothetical protein